MRVVPVIDLMNGQVVRGVGGRRGEYHPIQSRIAADSRPAAVAKAFAERFGFETAYVADLDAITKGEFSAGAWKEIAEAGLKVWLDAGVGNSVLRRQIVDCARELEFDFEMVVGLESLESPQELLAIQRDCGGRAIFSLDMRAGRPLTSIETWKSLTPVQIAAQVLDAAITRLILLDLADVGEAGGTRTLELCRELRKEHPQVELVAGGGVRGVADLRALADAGCDAALVASALHDGRLTRDDIHGL